jgi:hypothetical protein
MDAGPSSIPLEQVSVLAVEQPAEILVSEVLTIQDPLSRAAEPAVSVSIANVGDTSSPVDFMTEESLQAPQGTKSPNHAFSPQ